MEVTPASQLLIQTAVTALALILVIFAVGEVVKDLIWRLFK